VTFKTKYIHMKTLETYKSETVVPRIYESPVVEIFEIEVEKGFAISDGPKPPDDPEGPGMAPPSRGGPWSGSPWSSNALE
jgi:hypothetical protein